MDIRGKLWIIPGDNQEIFERDIPNGYFHCNFIQEFAEKNNLDYHYSYFDYQKAPCDMALLGNLTIKIDNEASTVICYIPDTVTDRQLEFIENNLDDISLNYDSVTAYYEIKPFLNDGEHAHTIEEIIGVCNRKHNNDMKRGM